MFPNGVEKHPEQPFQNVRLTFAYRHGPSSFTASGRQTCPRLSRWRLRRRVFSSDAVRALFTAPKQLGRHSTVTLCPAVRHNDCCLRGPAVSGHVHTSPMTTSPDRSPSDSYTDEPSALARVAWPQVAVLFGIGLATLGPILLAILLAL